MLMILYSGKHWKTLAGENIGEFCELMANRQSFLLQIIQTAEFANVFRYTVLSRVHNTEESV